MIYGVDKFLYTFVIFISKFYILFNLVLTLFLFFYSLGLGRTDSNSVEKKWKALRNQEKYYKKKLNIDLKLYREKLDLKNNSWNGAVIGYLYDN